MSRRPPIVARAAAALSMSVLLAAHVGSPDVFYSGKAGPYAVDVTVRPPQVVPGIAEIFVRVADSSVSRVVVRPVFWRAGSKGAPSGDEAKPVAGARGLYSGQLWLMSSGAYSVYVTASGAAGAGTVVVPVAAVATGQLALSPFLRVLLGVLGLLLCAGLVTAVHAAIGEAQVPPGEEIAPPRRRRARIATLVMVPVVAFIVLGGAHWWSAEAESYRRTLYRPTPSRSVVGDSAGVPVLTLTVLDSAWRVGLVTPPMPDHGKIAHQFIVRADSLDVFAHLHPVMPDRERFVTPLPPLPRGKYRVFTDVVHETGFERTIVDSFTVGAPLSSSGVARLDRDDAWYDGPVATVSGTSAERTLGDGLVIAWAGDAHPTVGQQNVLRFALRNASGGPVPVEPYLGMHGHAVVMRRDGAVFVHLHPSGTSSTAAQTAFALRDRGDTTAAGRLDLGAAPMTMAPAAALRELSFPYAFPSPGTHRVWVQLRSGGRVRTAAFDVTVGR